MRYTAADVAGATGGRLVGPDVALDGMSFDSRSLSPGALFVPIVAERDGHDFLTAAVAAGAPGYLTTGRIVEGATGIVVDDTLTALGALARAMRHRLDEDASRGASLGTSTSLSASAAGVNSSPVAARVVGITGSVGKTSCKDMTAAVLARRWVTAASEKSFNNDQGLPHTILNAPDGVEALVLEMGMRGFGEITRLCRVGQPQIGVITAIATAHTERVGGIDGVVRAKGELFETLPSNGCAVANADNEWVMACVARAACPVITFGAAGDVRIEGLTLDDQACAAFELSTPWGTVRVRLGVAGAHMAANAAAAATVGLLCGVPLDEVAAALGEARLSPWRMELHRLPNGAVVLNDAYNANPASMRAALDTLAALPASRRRAVLGTMAEIADPGDEHLGIAEYAAGHGIEVIPVGTEAYGVGPTADPIGALGELGPGDVVLVKGSRVAGLERIARSLIENLPETATLVGMPPR